MGSELALEKLKVNGELLIHRQCKFEYSSFHSENNNLGSKGLAETIISGAGIVQDILNLILLALPIPRGVFWLTLKSYILVN